uniref:YheC/YheD family protein n=1 Tax=Cohnella candidum TaxID=2674991 RepID=A0A3G3JVG9_9BACL|nr:YheC/YheD family protein [Cohnella candidum]
MKLRYGNNKLGKYRLMLTNPALSGSLPPTALATKANIGAMLAQNRDVYLKPNTGTGGFGIFKLSRHRNGYRLRNGTQSRYFASFDGAYAAFEKTKGRRAYLVQQGIPLLHYEGRPFDLRIMIQLNPGRKWEVTGIVGRLGQRHKVVTNYHNGGKPMPIQQLLTPYLRERERTLYVEKLKELGIRISSHMSRVFPRFPAFGVDIGIDKQLKPWIIEVNSRPDKYIFNALADKSMFRRIIQYARLQRKR